MSTSLFIPLFALLLLVPEGAMALTLIQAVSIFNLFVGLFLVATLIVFGSGAFVYFTRLGTWPSHRDTAIKVLEWGLAMLFVLVVLLGIVQFFQRYPRQSLFVVAVVIILAIAIFIVRTAAGKKKEEE